MFFNYTILYISFIHSVRSNQFFEMSIEVELSTSRLYSHIIKLDDRTLLMGKRTMSFEMKYGPFQRLSFRLDEDGVILLPKSLAGQASVAIE